MDLGPSKGLREAVLIRHTDREYGLRFMETFLNILASSPNVDTSNLNKTLDEYKNLLMIGGKEEKEKGKKLIEQDYKVFKKMFKPGQAIQGRIGDAITDEFKNVDIRSLHNLIGNK